MTQEVTYRIHRNDHIHLARWLNQREERDVFIRKATITHQDIIIRRVRESFHSRLCSLS